MAKNNLYLDSYIDMEVNWLKQLVLFDIITLECSDIDYLFKLIKFELHEQLDILEEIPNYQITVEDTLRDILTKYQLFDLIPAVGIALTSDQKDRIALTMYMRDRAIENSKLYEQIVKDTESNPTKHSDFIISSLKDLRKLRPSQDEEISAMDEHLVKNYFISIAIDSKKGTSLCRYVLDTLYRMHNTLIILPETEDKFRRNWAIYSLRALMSILSDAIRDDSALSTSFYNELFNTMSIYNSIIEEIAKKGKTDINKLLELC